MTNRMFIIGFLAFVLGTALALASFAAKADAPEDIRRVISDQVAALSEGDAERAFGHATPSIQSRFGSSAMFMMMVESGYGALIAPQKFEIEDIATEGDRAAARAYVLGADGKPYTAVYPLVRQPDGQWRIDGCYLESAPGRSL